MVHQSTTYFEQCHATDLDRQMSIAEKRSCWSTWLSHYTIGQTPERVRHARLRMDALARGEQIEALPGPTNAQRAAAYLATTEQEQATTDATAAPPGQPGTPRDRPAVLLPPPRQLDRPLPVGLQPTLEPLLDPVWRSRGPLHHRM